MMQKIVLAEHSFDLRTSGLWAQHASTAPLCFMFDNLDLKLALYIIEKIEKQLERN